MAALRRTLDASRASLRDLWADGNGPILLTVALGWSLSMGVRYVYPSLLPFFREAFALDLTTSGLLLSALWGAYALGQFPGGLLGDRLGQRAILVISTGVSAAAILVAASALDVAMLVVGTMAFGVATALYATTRFTIFTDIYDERAGTAVGITMAGGSVGNTVLPPLTAAVATSATWRLGLGLLVPVFVLVTAALWVIVPAQTGTRTEEPAVSIALLGRVLRSIRGDRIPVVVTVHLLLAFASLGFLGFYPTYLVEVKGFAPDVAALVFGLYFAVGVVVQPLVGASSDTFGPRVTLTTIAGLFSLGLFAVRAGDSVLFFVLVTVLLSNRNGVGVVTNTFIAETLPADIKGSGLGLLRSTWILVGATSPLFVGYLGDFGRLDQAFLVLAGVAGLATALALFVPRH